MKTFYKNSSKSILPIGLVAVIIGVVIISGAMIFGNNKLTAKIKSPAQLATVSQTASASIVDQSIAINESYSTSCTDSTKCNPLATNNKGNDSYKEIGIAPYLDISFNQNRYNTQVDAEAYKITNCVTSGSISLGSSKNTLGNGKKICYGGNAYTNVFQFDAIYPKMTLYLPDVPTDIKGSDGVTYINPYAGLKETYSFYGAPVKYLVLKGIPGAVYSVGLFGSAEKRDITWSSIYDRPEFINTGSVPCTSIKVMGKQLDSRCHMTTDIYVDKTTGITKIPVSVDIGTSGGLYSYNVSVGSVSIK